MRKASCLFVLLLFSVLSLYAQSDKTSSFMIIKGQVVDSLTSETVPYATLSIALTSNPKKPVKLLACDIDGKFETPLALAGTYIMTMQSIGKAPGLKTFTLKDGEKTINLGKLFLQEQTQQIGNVIVTAQKPLVKMEIDKLTYSLEDDPESVTSNTLDMLRKVPMVTVDGEDKIELKGSSNFKIYMNGKPSNLLSNNPSEVLKSMPANSVKNIEVITDPGAKYDAEGVGGIINIITNRSALEGYTGSIRANAGTLGRYGGGAYLSAKAGKFGITGTANYNEQDSPWNDYCYSRENYKNTTTHFIEQKGRNKDKGPFVYGNLELSYEIDTLNLLSLSVNRFSGSSKNKVESDQTTSDAEKNIIEQYLLNTNSKTTFGSTDLSLDYQHSTKKKDELLTLSYKFSNTPNDNDYTRYMKYLLGSNEGLTNNMLQENEAYTNEHTGQIDYTTPINKNHTIETGVKYIFRQNNSNTDSFTKEGGETEWNPLPQGTNDRFNHTQHIYSAYGGYALKAGKFGFKTGVRAEGTKLNVEYKNKADMNFDKNLFDFVPNATISYMLSMSQQIRFGYNLRIQRPNIWYLNPYVNNTNPQSISYGNPDLETEKVHNLNLNYSFFTQKLNVNASLSYSFNNNSIEQYSFVDTDGVQNTTYGNLGKSRETNLFTYVNWSPNPVFRLYANGSIGYVSIKSETLDRSNDGFQGRFFGGAQINLPKDFRINLYGGYGSQRIMLQSKNSAFNFHGISLNKDFLKKKLTVSASLNSPFMKRMKMENTTNETDFFTKSVNYWSTREFQISVSYRFGSLNQAIKKVRRGISNDDVKSGGNSNTGESIPQ
ncbi:MAG: TonB-dependent receptor [Massilibacteroides sp.]|nr:TonB-dependent receptor [Massilibacteroides sp.]